MLCGLQFLSREGGGSNSKESDAVPMPMPNDIQVVGPVGSAAENTANNNHVGWHQIDVFYGQRDDTFLTLPDHHNGWFSQVGQDQTVHWLLEEKRGGFFVDLAANDATMISNSYSLEANHEWDGLCIEANSKYWARLAYRNCKVIGAVVGHQRMEAINFNFGPKTSSSVNYHHGGYENGMLGGIVDNHMDNKVAKTNHELNNVVQRYTVPLQEIFERNHVPTTIDYFSLDVEGAESYIMSSFPFDQYRFRLLSIERPKADLQALLRSHNYTHVTQAAGKKVGKVSWDQIWAHESEMERIRALPSTK
mmetsp:Transcript_25400/g.28424  ORF Transcript_25400/g.28424 Transcript_25400/m.28424 type:complete len:306 (+) Transcript_25400:310-1227(+)